MAEQRVAVVGAGLAGLAAGLELKRQGLRVDLYDRSRLLGGKATSFEVEGVEVDNGQHVFLGCCTRFIKFVRSLEDGNPTDEPEADTSAGSSLLYLQPRFEALLLSRQQPPTVLTAVNCKPPFHLLPALLASRQLRILGRLQVAVGLLQTRGKSRPGETFADWLRRHKQTHLSRVGFWEPFVVPALNADVEEVSADEALFVIKTAFLSDASASRFGYARVPLARIARRAAERLDDVRLRTPVAALDVGAKGAVRGIVLSNGEKREYDGVLLAVPPLRLKTILQRPKQLGIFGLDQFTYAPIVDVHLWFDLPANTLLQGHTFAALLASPIQWVFEKPAPPGETYVCCSMSAARRQVGEPTETLIELARKELEAVLPILRQTKLLRSAATRDRDATFVPSVGLIRPGPHTSAPNVVLAGAWTATGWPATMESAVRSGQSAATALLERLS